MTLLNRFVTNVLGCMAGMTAMVSVAVADGQNPGVFTEYNKKWQNHTTCIVPPDQDQYFVDEQLKQRLIGPNSQLKAAQIALSNDGKICRGINQVVTQDKKIMLGYKQKGTRVDFTATDSDGKIVWTGTSQIATSERTTWVAQVPNSELAISSAIADALTAALPQINTLHPFEFCKSSIYLDTHPDVRLSDTNVVYRQYGKNLKESCQVKLYNTINGQHAEGFGENIFNATQLSIEKSDVKNEINPNDTNAFVAYTLNVTVKSRRAVAPQTFLVAQIIAQNQPWKYISETGIGLCNKKMDEALWMRGAEIAATVDAQTNILKRIYGAVIQNADEVQDKVLLSNKVIRRVEGKLRPADYEHPIAKHFDSMCRVEVTIRMLKTTLERLIDEKERFEY